MNEDSKKEQPRETTEEPNTAEAEECSTPPEASQDENSSEPEEGGAVPSSSMEEDQEGVAETTEDSNGSGSVAEVGVPAAESAVEQAEVAASAEPPPADEATLPGAETEPGQGLGTQTLEEAYDSSIQSFAEGEIVKGTVISVDREEIMVDIGFKSEGYIPVSELETTVDGLPTVNVGDEIDVYIVRREDANGQLVLSKEIADQKLVWDDITKAYEEGTPVEGKIAQRIKGGLQVNIGKLRAFLPASQIDLRPIQDFDTFMGKTLPMKVVKLSKRRRNIVLSRRVLLEEQLAVQKTKLLEELRVGQLRTGAVKSITNFGAFVDLGGIDGLLHKTDMSWSRINNPADVVSIGQELEVIVLSVDHKSEKVSLGLKQKTADPWEGIEARYPIASTVRGKIVSIVNYGAFLELEEGVEGLIHISEMSWTRRNVAPSKIVSKGQVVEAVVLDIDKGNQRLSLGLKQMELNPWEQLEDKYPIGTKVRGTVRNLTDFGAFVEIEDGIDGLVHVSDMSWHKRVVNPREILKEGDEVEVMVLSIDAEAQKISLGLKQIEPDPWLSVPDRYKIGSVVRGKIVNLTSFGAFAQLEDGIEGLIHISELDEQRVERPEDVVSVGDELDLKVIHLDPAERRIGLSLRAARAERERATVSQYQQKQRSKPEKPRHEPTRPKEEEREELTVFGGLLKEELDKSSSEDN